jgi:hypothetical protein
MKVLGQKSDLGIESVTANLSGGIGFPESVIHKDSRDFARQDLSDPERPRAIRHPK